MASCAILVFTFMVISITCPWVNFNLPVTFWQKADDPINTAMETVIINFIDSVFKINIKFDERLWKKVELNHSNLLLLMQRGGLIPTGIPTLSKFKERRIRVIIL